MPTLVSCPTCGKEVVWRTESRWRPFCSERCRLIDLGDWLDETHRISDPGDEPGDGEPWPSPENDVAPHH
jgi:hypothetical protein